MGITKGLSDKATFPDLAGATQQLEEVVDSETKSPADAGLFFVPLGLASGYFCFQAPLASW